MLTPSHDRRDPSPVTRADTSGYRKDCGRTFEGVGLQTYASFTRQGGRARFTAYLALEAYAVKPPRGAELGHAPHIEAQGSVP